MMASAISSGARAGMAAHGHSKPQEPRAALLLCSPPSFPCLAVLPGCLTILATRGGAASVWLLQTLASESHIPLCLESIAVHQGCSSAMSCGKLVDTKIINALRSESKCIWPIPSTICKENWMVQVFKQQPSDWTVHIFSFPGRYFEETQMLISWARFLSKYYWLHFLLEPLCYSYTRPEYVL